MISVLSSLSQWLFLLWIIFSLFWARLDPFQSLCTSTVLCLGEAALISFSFDLDSLLVTFSLLLSTFFSISKISSNLLSSLRTQGYVIPSDVTIGYVYLPMQMPAISSLIMDSSRSISLIYLSSYLSTNSYSFSTQLYSSLRPANSMNYSLSSFTLKLSELMAMGQSSLSWQSMILISTATMLRVCFLKYLSKCTKLLLISSTELRRLTTFQICYIDIFFYCCNSNSHKSELINFNTYLQYGRAMFSCRMSSILFYIYMPYQFLSVTTGVAVDQDLLCLLALVTLSLSLIHPTVFSYELPDLEQALFWMILAFLCAYFSHSILTVLLMVSCSWSSMLPSASLISIVRKIIAFMVQQELWFYYSKTRVISLNKSMRLSLRQALLKKFLICSRGMPPNFSSVNLRQLSFQYDASRPSSFFILPSYLQQYWQYVQKQQ